MAACTQCWGQVVSDQPPGPSSHVCCPGLAGCLTQLFCHSFPPGVWPWQEGVWGRASEGRSWVGMPPSSAAPGWWPAQGLSGLFLGSCPLWPLPHWAAEGDSSLVLLGSGCSTVSSGPLSPAPTGALLNSSGSPFGHAVSAGTWQVHLPPGPCRVCHACPSQLGCGPRCFPPPCAMDPGLAGGRWEGGD